MILIIRNYREVLIRTPFHGHFRYPHKLSDYIKIGKKNSLDGYINNIKLYDEFKGEKMHIYYEDLMTGLEPVEDVLKFLNVKYDLSDFDEKEHRNNSYNVYNNPSNGNKSATTMNNPLDFNHYSKLLDEKELVEYDNYIKYNHIELYERYLKRYER